MSQTGLPEGFDTAAVTTRIRRIWSQVLEVEHIEDRANFFDLGGSSIDAVLMLRMLHAELSATVELTDFFNMRTLHDLVIYVRRSLEEQNAVSS